ncbi:glutamic acid-rich protein-like [Sphaeramia orbicularis]|uniref:glutamic acid-rich protein-like n=1 Tax=Sphaeramia orbicularis TaxID=375764 RepID=UPI00117C2F3C|nr:glutamic acid-rich protein-like [Sphaeramia orbicularis]
MRNARLCSAHFISGKASMDHGSPDFVPSVFSYTLAVTASGHSKLERRQETQVTRNPDDEEYDAITAAESLVSLHSQVTDVLQLSVVKEEVQPEQQEWSSSPDQEDPELPLIKEEQEELWTNKETDIIKFRFSPVHVKSEDDKGSDVHQLLLVKEEVPSQQQEQNPSLEEDQENPEDPELPDIKEEQEELWSNQEADITKFPSTPVAVKSEDDEEAQSSQEEEKLRVQRLKVLIQQRLNLDSEMILGLFERALAEYKEELFRSKEENKQQRKLLDTVLNPQVLLNRTGCPPDVHHLSVVKVEIPLEQQEWSSNVDQDQEDLEPPHIKEEQEEVWTNQEADVTKFTSTPVLVKSEDDDDDDEEDLSSQLHQRQTEEKREEADEVDCEGSEPARSFHPIRYLQSSTDEQIEDFEETEDSDEEWTPNTEPQMQFNKKPKLIANRSTEQMETEFEEEDCGGSEPDINLIHMIDLKYRNVQSSKSKSNCKRTFNNKSYLERHIDTDNGERLVGSF